MKLLNHTSLYIAVILFFVLPAWAGLFYYAMLDEIYDSMDDGLENQKMLVMQKAVEDSTVLNKRAFEDGYYAIKAVQKSEYLSYHDVYKDTLMFMQNEQDYEPVRMLITVFKQKEQLYEMRVITSMVEEDDLIEDLLFSLLWLYLGLLVSIIILNNLVLKKIWQPFYKLLDRMKRFRLDRPTQIDTVKSNIDEFTLLNETVQKVLQSNIDAYLAQKEFVENASHELQTPIAVIRNKLELLSEENKLSEKQMEEIALIMSHVNRMGRMNKSLLLLSKIENKQFDSLTEVDLVEMVRNLVSSFKEISEFKSIQLQTSLPSHSYIITNRELLNILLTNLIKNALTHSKADTVVRITLVDLKIKVENQGNKSLNPEKIFTRFYKEETSRKSTGLGLAIARAIAENAGFSLSYVYEAKHIFILDLNSI